MGTSSKPKRRLTRLKDWLEDRLHRLHRPRAAVLIIAFGLLLNAPSLFAGLVADDHIHQLLLQDQPEFGPLTHRPLDLFMFSNGDPDYTLSMMNEGFFGWWTHPSFKLAFFRPLSSLTHWLDHLMWPGSALAAHLHSLVWFALTLTVVALVFRRFLQPAWVAGLALLLYAIDDGHGSPVAFICNRNVLVAASIGFLALSVHDRWVRDRWRPGAVIGPVLLGLGLLAGEAALAVCGYLAAHALYLDRASWRRRLVHLLPYAAVVVLWRFVYRSLGYGVAHSGVYVDPLTDPLGFTWATLMRFPHLLVGQLALPWSDFAILYPPGVDMIMWACAVALLAFGLWLILPLLRAEPIARFWLVGLALAAIPVCATFPADRLLIFVGVGGMGLLALLFQRSLLDGGGQWLRRIATKASVAVLVGIHIVLAPLLLPARSYTVSTLRDIQERVDSSIPSDSSITERTVVIVSSPVEPLHAYIQCTRAAKRIPRPRALRALSAGQTGLSLFRSDERTLVVGAALGFIPNASETMARSRSDGFYVGETVELEGMSARVNETTEDGRPARVTFTFNQSLENPGLLWLTWGRDRLVPFSPPAVGESVDVEPIDPMAMFTE